MLNAKLSGLTVLIVEDIRAVRAIIRTILHDFGIEKVEEASDGEAALDVLRKQHVDIVITDICMEPMDGIEFTRNVRRPDNGFNPYVPVLMVSGHTEVSCVKNALDAGVTAFLAKPVTPANLRKKLMAIVAMPRKSVRTKTYCGPDRRRSAAKTQRLRRASDSTIII